MRRYRLSFTDIDLAGYSRQRERVMRLLAELLLEKTQIVRLNEKDLIDTIMLLRATSGGPERHGIHPQRGDLRAAS